MGPLTKGPDGGIDLVARRSHRHLDVGTHEGLDAAHVGAAIKGFDGAGVGADVPSKGLDVRVRPKAVDDRLGRRKIRTGMPSTSQVSIPSLQGLTLGQRRSEGGSNEIKAIPELLEALVLEGCIVTIDAMDCQTSIANAIQEAGADYVLWVKDNQKELRADIERLFDRRQERGFEADYIDVDGGHGRVETRHCWAIEVGGRGLIDSSRWPEVSSVALVETERFEAEPSAENGPASGKMTTERRHVISGLPPDAVRLLEATRRHWRIENQLHWSLDVAFGEGLR